MCVFLCCVCSVSLRHWQEITFIYSGLFPFVLLTFEGAIFLVQWLYNIMYRFPISFKAIVYYYFENKLNFPFTFIHIESILGSYGTWKYAKTLIQMISLCVSYLSFKVLWMIFLFLYLLLSSIIFCNYQINISIVKCNNDTEIIVINLSILIAFHKELKSIKLTLFNGNLHNNYIYFFLPFQNCVFHFCFLYRTAKNKLYFKHRAFTHCQMKIFRSENLLYLIMTHLLWNKDNVLLRVKWILMNNKNILNVECWGFRFEIENFHHNL